MNIETITLTPGQTKAFYDILDTLEDIYELAQPKGSLETDSYHLMHDIQDMLDETIRYKLIET